MMPVKMADWKEGLGEERKVDIGGRILLEHCMSKTHI